MIVRDKRKEEREVVYQYEDGLKAFIEEVNQDHTPMHDQLVLEVKVTRSL